MIPGTPFACDKPFKNVRNGPENDTKKIKILRYNIVLFLLKKNLKEIDQENVRTETKKKIENMIRTQTEGCAREMDTSIKVERTSTKDKNKDTKDEVTNAIIVEDNNKKRVSKNECKRVTWADVVRGNSEEETKQQSMLINLK